MLTLITNTSVQSVDFIEIVTAFNNQSNRQTPTITWSPGESSNVFNAERNHPVNTTYSDQDSSDDEETKPDKGEISEDEETKPGKRKRSEY